MQIVWVVSKKEFASFFNSPIAYVFVAVFLALANWLFFQGFFLAGQATMREFFGVLPWLYLLLVPAITMREWAEEKRSGTIEVLLTLPITDLQATLSKFFGSLAFLGFALALSLTIPLSVSVIGSLDAGPVIGGYVGALLLGGAYISLGLAISSVTKNQIIAFLLTVSIAFFMFIIGEDVVTSSVAQGLRPLLRFLSLGFHFSNLTRGIVDSRDVVYYLSFIILFLHINSKSLESRNL